VQKALTNHVRIARFTVPVPMFYPILVVFPPQRDGFTAG